jgi:SP family general alpha glucoside:H+ symporter-like MFS transporter
MAAVKTSDDIDLEPPKTALGSPARDGVVHGNRAVDEVINSAKSATDKEHRMTLLQGIKLYPKAVAWSLLISTCICMEGYDVCLLANFYGFPQFNQKYGHQLPDGSYQVSPAWQAGLSNGANVGEVIGLFINGFVSERFGYRYTVMTCLVLIVAFTAIFFTAQSVVDLQVAEILCGIPWGVFQTLTITYASEVCPVALRGYLTTYVNFCWGLGQVIGTGVIKSMLGRTDQWAYRVCAPPYPTGCVSAGLRKGRVNPRRPLSIYHRASPDSKSMLTHIC